MYKVKNKMFILMYCKKQNETKRRLTRVQTGTNNHLYSELDLQLGVN